jgi:hypothetical protein
MRIHTANRKQRTTPSYGRQRWDRMGRQTDRIQSHYLALARRLGRDDVVRLLEAWSKVEIPYRAKDTHSQPTRATGG